VPYDPGFSATVDGEAAVIEKVDGGLMAILVPAGKHSIVFTYYSAGLNYCLVLSALTAAFVLVKIVLENVHARKTNVLATKKKA